MKIGILYICTGKYTIFWKDFYLSCEKYFIKDAEKHYFVFTDSAEIDFEKDNKNIHRIFQKNLGWPDNTLRRYQMFLRIKNELRDYDYVLFFNANLIFIDNISAEDFIPTGVHKLVGCIHPGYYNKKISEFSYEKNKLSTAFIDKGHGSYYFAGGINGGKTDVFMETIQLLNKNIEKDDINKITAKWHDESHWNWFLNNNIKIIKILTPSYLYFDKLRLPFKPKIILRDKKDLGGHASFRNKIELKLLLNNFKDLLKKIITK